MIRPILITLAISLVPVAITAPAEALDRPCVTRKEFRRIDDGNHLVRVHRIFDTKGREIIELPGYKIREYRPCTGNPAWSYVSVEYKFRKGAWRVWHKWRYIA